MGHTFGWKTQKQLTDYLNNPSEGANCRVIAHKSERESEPVLWQVVEITNSGTGEVSRAIICNVIRKDGHGDFGYKDMDESAEPYFWSCPVRFFDMVPEVKVGWRDNCREYSRKQGDLKAIKPGCLIAFKSEKLLTSWACLRGAVQVVSVAGKSVTVRVGLNSRLRVHSSWLEHGFEIVG